MNPSPPNLRFQPTASLVALAPRAAEARAVGRRRGQWAKREEYPEQKPI